MSATPSPFLTAAERTTILDAASALENHAVELRRAHTSAPDHEWDGQEPEAEAEYNAITLIAARLRRIRNRQFKLATKGAK